MPRKIISPSFSKLRRAGRMKDRKFPVEPFQEYQKNPAWNVLDQAIEDLVENQDLVETNVRKFIIGLIMRRLIENDLLKV